jgi:hypothetical protein
MLKKPSERTTESAKKVAQAMSSLKAMSADQKIELMLKAKVITARQAAAARKVLTKP